MNPLFIILSNYYEPLIIITHLYEIVTNITMSISHCDIFPRITKALEETY
ncbi:hypothetical protein HCJ59_13785 [Listeria sp. FSL L7-1515]|uniref:Uncharacterized protein n=1 Tax=Listeria immobilis TaxID=2713502 RepID=A0ABR6SZ47_9LIST|nr:hypothetical protein [Listeria immobilis]MBC6304105.1 hypothetical protein [Listeria immobilis]